jgi:hypothetical protein
MTKTEAEPGELTIRPLTPETWDAFADLAERHNGVRAATVAPATN